MNFNEFQERVLEYLSERGHKVELRNVHRNNGIRNTGLSVMNLIHSSSGIKLHPKIYLEYFYNEYLEDEHSAICMERILKDILILVHAATLESSFSQIFCTPEEDVHKLETEKRRIGCKLINTKRNLDILEQIPHIPYLDLSIVFYLKPDNEYSLLEEELITKEQADKWNVGVDELLQMAKANQQKVQLTEINGQADLKQLTQSAASQCLKTVSIDMDTTMEPIGESKFMYISNEGYGATELIFTETWDAISTVQQANLAILPISIKEVIVTVDTEKRDYRALKNLLDRISSTDIPDEFFLSENIYRYRRDTGKIEMLYI